MPCDTCDKLRRENRELREEIEEWKSAGDTAEPALRLAAVTQMTPQCARVITRMSQSPGHVVLASELIEVMGYNGEDRDLPCGRTDSIKALQVIVSNSRRALERMGLKGSLKNFRGMGYYITPEAAQRVRALL